MTGISPPTEGKKTTIFNTGWNEYESSAETRQSVLGGLHQIVHMDVNVVVVFYVIYSGLRGDLIDD